jgi:hypothetical protein
MRRLLPLLLLLAAGVRAEDDPAKYVQFVEENTGSCVQRNGVQIQVRSTHPTRRIKVWLDRYQTGVGTGDRSRSELAPGAEPEPLGCSRSDAGKQEWRIVRAVFLD